MRKTLIQYTKPTWTLDDDGVMIVQWRGSMPNFLDQETPWEEVKDKIRTVTFSDGLISIGAQAFSGCKNLESVDFPNTLCTISYGAFMGCTSLKEVIFPEHTVLRHVQSEKTGCKMYERVVFIKRKAFMGTPWAEELWGKYIMEDDVLLEAYHESPVVEVPEGIRAIAPYAFKDLPVTFVRFPKTLTTIGAFAFENTNLVEVEFGEHIEVIGNGAFAKNPDLRAAYFLNDNTKIGENTFYECYKDPIDPRYDFAVKGHGSSALRKFCVKHGIRFRTDHTRVDRFRKLPYESLRLIGKEHEDANDKLKRRYLIYGILINEKTKEVEVVKCYKKHMSVDPIYGHRIRVVEDKLCYSAHETIRNPIWEMYISPKAGWYTTLEMFWGTGEINMRCEGSYWKDTCYKLDSDTYRCEWYLSWEVNKDEPKLTKTFMEWWFMTHPEYHLMADKAA